MNDTSNKLYLGSNIQLFIFDNATMTDSVSIRVVQECCGQTVACELARQNYNSGRKFFRRFAVGHVQRTATHSVRGDAVAVAARLVNTYHRPYTFVVLGIGRALVDDAVDVCTAGLGRDPDRSCESLSNLDAKLRTQMRTELQELQQRFGVTTIYVTPDFFQLLHHIHILCNKIINMLLWW
jgi:hypothetical protein